VEIEKLKAEIDKLQHGGKGMQYIDAARRAISGKEGSSVDTTATTTDNSHHSKQHEHFSNSGPERVQECKDAVADAELMATTAETASKGNTSSAVLGWRDEARARLADAKSKLQVAQNLERDPISRNSFLYAKMEKTRKNREKVLDRLRKAIEDEEAAERRADAERAIIRQMDVDIAKLKAESDSINAAATPAVPPPTTQERIQDMVQHLEALRANPMLDKDIANSADVEFKDCQAWFSRLSAFGAMATANLASKGVVIHPQPAQGSATAAPATVTTTATNTAAPAGTQPTTGPPVLQAPPEGGGNTEHFSLDLSGISEAISSGEGEGAGRKPVYERTEEELMAPSAKAAKRADTTMED
jgi:hypothetical protein